MPHHLAINDTKGEKNTGPSTGETVINDSEKNEGKEVALQIEKRKSMRYRQVGKRRGVDRRARRDSLHASAPKG